MYTLMYMLDVKCLRLIQHVKDLQTYFVDLTIYPVQRFG